MDDPALILAMRVLTLVGAPIILGLAASTWLRAALYSALALYLLPVATFGWELYALYAAGAPLPGREAALKQVHLLIGSAVAGATLGLLVYAAKRLCQAAWRAVRATLAR
jgi:hypothetical protein